MVGGWVGGWVVGEAENKTNSALLSWGLAELGNDKKNMVKRLVQKYFWSQKYLGG